MTYIIIIKSIPHLVPKAFISRAYAGTIAYCVTAIIVSVDIDHSIPGS